MKRIALLGVVVGLLVVPTALAAQPTAKSASAQCKALKASMRAADFVALHKNLGRCVAKHDAQARVAVTNAAKSCKADQANAAWRSTDNKTFAELYGTSNAQGKGNGNAYGKCVSSRAAEKTAAVQAAELKAAKSCKAWRAARTTAQAALAGKTFEQAYGTARNAYGKCVSAQTKANA